MLTIENGRFSDCIFLEDLKNKNIVLKKYRNRHVEIEGLIVEVLHGASGYKVWVDVNGYPNIITSFNLHNIEDASIV